MIRYLAAFLAVFFAAALAFGQQEAQARADPQVRAVDQFLDRAVGVMRFKTESVNAPSTCGLSRGSITFGTPVNSSFGDCYIANTYIDFWSFTAQAGSTGASDVLIHALRFS